ncbi:MAG: TlpA family protein disulfide reductase [Pseudobacter sp.]|uniref:TlpA family protein disulfide reductase n=1 Tax=Pseudobacter sp. TaxID=2045420 RepID=UPI003F81AE60
MKRVVFFMLLLAMSAATQAQHAIIKGKFIRHIAPRQYADRIYFFKAGQGNVVLLSEIMLNKDDHSFKIDLPKNDLNEIRYIGFEDELYPVYLRKGEDITIEANSGLVSYLGNLSKENKVFSGWFDMVAPLRRIGYSIDARNLAPLHYDRTLDSLLAPVEKFTGHINTGNKAFDRYVKYMLPYSFRMDALAPFMRAFEYSKKDQYPAYIVNLFNTEKFADQQLWTLPFGYNYIQNLGFVNHIIYKSEMGSTQDLVIPEISNDHLRAEFILKALDRGEYQGMTAFVGRNLKYMITKDQQDRMKVFEKRASLKEPGGNWIDFAYPDANGKMHRLSDHLGKVVLIDVWATWCRPCIQEQPALEELEKAFEGKDVAFISVSIDTEKDKWKKMVEDKKLSGLHLFSNNEGVIIKDYQVISVPRFILFDKEGKTVMFDAIRPSDPKLKELIQSKL